MRSAGELIDHLAELSPDERRGILDRARAEVGLPSTAEVEAAQPKPLTVRTVNGGGGFTSCAAAECTASPTRNGIFYSPDVRRWFCDQHAHLAQPGDLEPRRFEVRLSPSGVPIPDDPVEDERERQREASRRAQRQAQADDRSVEAAERAASSG
jgi:hypothetical protein